MYLQIANILCIWKIFLFKMRCYFKKALAAIHLSGTVIGDIIIILTHPWFQGCISWKKSVIWWYHFQSSVFLWYESFLWVIISREHLKWSVWQGKCVYFTTLVEAVYNNKRSVVDSRKFEEYVYLRKTIVDL